MLRFLFIIVAVSFAAIFSSAQAQSKQHIKGPKAKHAKPWKHTTAVVSHKPVKLQGAEAKNADVWKKEEQESTIITSSSNNRLKGPKAKNNKIWMKDATEN
ncbi:hypothetical protein LVD15_01710 [Fulvivirga maritima]|uniref:hypothetical protein n=1 Tax=Fulvivirga maritima TaxID=2904247 RepID=UPI001F37380A|nr:hypothetical protein [Fulvivirga maritima]UII27167.1 hypothetical protein LVD15_01710 [Fulvivirga maritima]